MTINPSRVARFVQIATDALEPTQEQAVDEIIEIGNEVIKQLVDAMTLNPIFGQLLPEEVVAGTAAITEQMDEESKDAALVMLLVRLLQREMPEN